MLLTKMKIEKRDIPVIAFSALGGFLLVVLALASRSIAAAAARCILHQIAARPSGRMPRCTLTRKDGEERRVNHQGTKDTKIRREERQWPGETCERS